MLNNSTGGRSCASINKQKSGEKIVKMSSGAMRTTMAALAAGLFSVILNASALADEIQSSNPIEKHVGHLLAGSGKWRATNPDYEPGSTEAIEYGMNYQWGPHKKHVVAEIISIYADGRTEKEWTLFLTYNPVTEIAYIEQTGKGGVYFRGEISHAENDLHVESGLIYIPNGTVKSVRDEVEVIDENTRLSRVFERDERGGWKQVREWTWRLVADAE